MWLRVRNAMRFDRNACRLPCWRLMLAVPRSAAAANKEHQQLMAELRMLQEQQQQLQQLLGGLADTLKVDHHAARRATPHAARRSPTRSCSSTASATTSRAAREDGRHQRPDLDDDAGARGAAADDRVDAARRRRRPGCRRPTRPANPARRHAAGGPPAAAAATPAASISPKRMYDQSYGDYSAGQYDLAIEGFQAFIRTFPTSPNADEAQLYIGNSLYNAGKNAEARRRAPEGDQPTTRRATACPVRVLQARADVRSAQAARHRQEGVRDRRPEIPELVDAVLAQQALERLNKRRNSANSHANDWCCRRHN